MADLTREQFDALIREIEGGIGRDRAQLRRRVVTWALVGYAGLLAPLLAAIAIAGAFFSTVYWADRDGRILGLVLGAVALFGLGALALRTFAVRIGAPQGVRVAREDAPALFAALDALRAPLNAVAFDHVLLTPEANAAVVQQPRFGLLGWSRNHLLIGLPLLESMSREELIAVLAHEFAHLSRHHGRLSHWIYRLRRSWERAFAEMNQRPRGSGISLRGLTTRFVHWFWPQFNAHAFVLSRAQEYEADATAAELTSHEAIASALLRLHVVSRRLGDDFWSEIWRGAKEAPEPPSDAMQRARQYLSGPLEVNVVHAWQGEALRAVTTNADTHPCVQARLAALGVNADEVLVTTCASAVPAAESLLGEHAAKLREKVSAFWRQETASTWAERHARTGVLSHRLDVLQHAGGAARPSERQWDEAVVALDLHGDTAAAPLLRSVLAHQPDHAIANLHLGRILLEEGNGEGEAFIERAVTADHELMPKAGALLHDHYRRSGQTDRLRALAARLDRYEHEAAAARRERSQVSATDAFLPHGLDAATLGRVCALVAAEPDANRAELAQKKLQYFPERRLFVLCVHRPVPWHRLGNAEADRDLARRVAQKVELPGRVLVIPPSGGFRSVARAIRRVAGAQIWAASQP